jgi:hypothetical protein
MHETEIATAADYADAMLTARRAKHVLVLLLMLVITGQLVIFFCVRYDVIPMGERAAPVPAPVVAPPTTDTVDVAVPAPTTTEAERANLTDLMHYLCGTCLAIGLLGTIILSFVLLLIVNIMLVGRLIGVSRLTSAYLWCIVLLVFLFPWQSFLNASGLTPEKIAWKLPGVLYSWGELTAAPGAGGAKFAADLSQYAILKWVRYVAFPVVALIMLLVIQFKSNKGMRQALGEEEAMPGEA